MIYFLSFSQFTFSDFFFTFFNFLPFFTLFILPNYSRSFELFTFLGNFFIDENEQLFEKSYTSESIFDKYFNVCNTVSDFFTEFQMNSSAFTAIDESFQYTEFFNLVFEFSVDEFDDFLNILIYSVIYYFFSEIAEEESDILVNFIQIAMSVLLTTEDLFMLFLGFEFLTVTLVLAFLLNNEKVSYSRSIIMYFILSVVVSLVIFFFFFFCVLITTGTTFLTFFNFSDFFISLYTIFSEQITELESLFYIPLIKLFLCFVILLFCFKFTVGPIALWTFYLYPSFTIILLIFQMVAFKYSLYFLFLEFFDYVFLLDLSIVAFYTNIFALLITVTMFIGCLAYKVNELKMIFIITTFSQIGYVVVSFITPSFTLLLYSLNYFIIYLYSTLIIFLIFIYINSLYNIKYTHQLFILKHVDLSLYVVLIVLLFSMSGLPPFLGFFVKYFLLLKLLIHPLLFKFGVILLFTSFITMYVYLSLIYSLIKPTLVQETDLFFSSINYTTNSSFLAVFFEEVFIFIFNSISFGFILFLSSPVLLFFIPNFTEYHDFFEELLFFNYADLLEYYFSS